MDNQHRKISGYRELNEEEIAAMNEVKAKGQELSQLIMKMEETSLEVDKRWLAIGRTHLQEGLMALTRAITKPTFFAITLMVLAGCVSPHKEASGTYLKTAHTEFRSPFGTNDSFAKLQRCKGPEYMVLFYMEGDFTECKDLPIEEAYAWQHGYSQGQGGQVLEGMMNAGAVGAIAATRAGGNATATAGAVAIQQMSVTVPKGHRR